MGLKFYEMQRTRGRFDALGFNGRCSRTESFCFTPRMDLIIYEELFKITNVKYNK